MAAQKRLEFGGHALVWAGDWSPAGARAAISGAARAGYDYVEVALLDPWSVDTAMTKDLLAEYGVRAHASLGLSFETDVTSTNPAVVAKGDELLRKATDVLHALGGTELCGVLYSALGKYPGPASKESYANSVSAMQRLGDYAADKGITVSLEVVNRYETNIMNTGLEGLAFLDQVNRSNVLLHLDTYHMNIEEQDLAGPIKKCGKQLGYVHVGASHRGPLGTGNIDFDSFFGALSEIGYKGTITFESFSSAVVHPDLSSTLGIWRNLWTDNKSMAINSRKYMEQKIRVAYKL